MFAGSRSTAPGGGSKSSQSPSSRLESKRKAKELATSGVSMQPAIRRQASDAGSATLSRTSPVTGEQYAVSSRQLGSPLLSGCIGGTCRSESAKTVAEAQSRRFRNFEPAIETEIAKSRKSKQHVCAYDRHAIWPILNAQVANTCVPTGERLNKRPILISGVSDTHAFLAWLRQSCLIGSTAQLKGKILTVVPSNAEGFQIAITSLRSLARKDGDRFHTFTLPEDRCVRLMVKNLVGACMRASS